MTDSSSPPTSATTPGTDRIDWIDALRGFALFGVLLANLRELTLYAYLPKAAAAAMPTAGWDESIALALAALVDGKSFTLFTLLFGVGFALQTEGDGTRRGRFVRRLLVLLAIGLVHGTLWWGDILRHYALLGLLLVPLARLSPRALVVLGIFLAVAATPLLRPTMAEILPKVASTGAANAAAFSAFSGESFTAAWRANLTHDLWVRIAAWGLPFYALGRLLIGAAIGRSPALRQPHEHLVYWDRLLACTLPLGLLATAFVQLRDQGWSGLESPWWSTEVGRGTLRAVRSTASLALGTAYFAGFVRLYFTSAGRRALTWLQPVGRMALTNYLLQTLLALAVFYGAGLGLGPRYGLVGVVAFAVLVFFLQWLASRWWLARFRFGPLEWLWRGATHGAWPPLRQD